MCGAHKLAFFNEVREQYPDYVEWAADLKDPGPVIQGFTEYAKAMTQKRERSDAGPDTDEPSKKQQTEGEKTCVVCVDNPAEVCFVPCGHMITCCRCAPRASENGCPMCRADVGFYLKVYT